MCKSLVMPMFSEILYQLNDRFLIVMPILSLRPSYAAGSSFVYDSEGTRLSLIQHQPSCSAIPVLQDFIKLF